MAELTSGKKHSVHNEQNAAAYTKDLYSNQAINFLRFTMKKRFFKYLYYTEDINVTANTIFLAFYQHKLQEPFPPLYTNVLSVLK
jgi:hypothetical protein